MFKKFLTVLGAITLALMLFFGLRYTIVSISGRMADKSSAAYANEAVKAITSNWNAQELVNRAHPSLFANTDPQAFTTLFDKIREIGSLKQFEACKGASAINYSRAIVFYPSGFTLPVGSSTETNAKYTCNGLFDKGPAAVTMILHQDAKTGWQIFRINIDSPFFKPAAPAKPAAAPSSTGESNKPN